MSNVLPMPMILTQPFYSRDPVVVARELLGKVLVRTWNEHLLSGVISETEAYLGENDTASHASRGRTPRTQTMYGPPGRAYVYLVYGMFNMLNVVTEPKGVASAVLIRALQPLQGREFMREMRKSGKGLTDGPGKLCQALAIDREMNGFDLTAGRQLWIKDINNNPETIHSGPRIGIDYASDHDRLAEWRFWIG